jgi:acetate kinase
MADSFTGITQTDFRKMTILICNSGSSSLKFSLFEADDEVLLADGTIDWTTRPTQFRLLYPGQPVIREELHLREHSEAFAIMLSYLRTGPVARLLHNGEIEAVGHRIVHGGTRFTAAARITAEVQDAIHELCDLAPLHNLAGLEGIRTITRVLPSVPQVAVFDTAFHTTLSPAARTYAIPRAWTTDWGIYRYGFHGLSHAYCSSRATAMLGRNRSRVVIAHLGNGASVSAVRNGVCLDTSMGFTPLEGVVMGTRSGSVDPGALLYLMQHKGLTVEHLHHVLNYESGLLGLSGISSDMREILQKASDHHGARLALDVYVHRLVQTVGAMAAVLGGVDALAFTAGVGENSAQVRELVCRNLGHLGVRLDCAANSHCRPDADVAQGDSPARVLVISSREDLTILRETRQVIRSDAPWESAPRELELTTETV